MDKEDLKHFYKRLNATLASVGSMDLRALPEEEPARQHARRSLVTARAVPAGQPLTAADLTWKRPAHGISPRNFDEVLGMRARRSGGKYLRHYLCRLAGASRNETSCIVG